MTRRRKIIVLGAAVAVLAAAATVVLWLRKSPSPNILEVPLGVEEAVIITSDSSPIEPLPFAWGVGLNVRIAQARDLPGGHVYDVRYIVNHAGDFDLKDYLRYSDGRDPAGLPSFKVRGLERLSQSIEARIAETEETGVALSAWYYKTLWILALAWVGWLLVLIFVRRRRKREASPPPAGPSLAERIRAYLGQLESGTLDVEQQAELELMIFRQWRGERSWDDQPMARSLAAFRADPEVAQAFAELENWLHRPVPAASPAQVARSLRSGIEKSPSTPAREAAHVTFAHPSLLFLLVIPVILAFWEWTRKGQPLVMPFDHGRQRRGRFLNLLVLSANTLPAMLLAVAILFLARPITFAPPQTERKLTNIQIVLDSSGSMGTPYGPQSSQTLYTRFDAAMDGIDQFLTHRQGDAFGLTIFSRAFIHWVPLTLDTSAIRLARPFIRVFTLSPAQGRPGYMPNEVWGGTFIAKALGGAIDVLVQRPAGDRMIILLTDGDSGDIQGGRDRQIIDRLRQNHITVFAVNLAGEIVEPGLVNIATETGGQVFSVVDNDALRAVFRQIDQMKRVEVLQKEAQVIDYFHPFLWAAATVLMLQTLAMFGLRFTPW